MKKDSIINNIISNCLLICLLATLLFSGVTVLVPSPVQADENAQVIIGQAKRGEKGVKDNKPGDQTGNEVFMTEWSYRLIGSEHWQYVLRAKDPETGRKIAAIMIQACNNEHIGYDQNYPDRGTLYERAKKAGWDVTKVKKDCETTCTCIISVCLNAVGIKVPKYWMSEDVKDDLEATGLFYCFSSKDYVASSDKLTVGDILVTPDRHTAMVVDSPHPFTYPVKYTDAGGKSHTTQIAENSSILLNLNNGEEPGKVKVDSEISLDDSVPVKEDYTFLGWEKTGKNSFSASYRGNMPVIQLNFDAVEIEDKTDINDE